MEFRLLEFDSLHEGRLVKRYKRFLADIELDNGDLITAHCANTGPMRGILKNNAKVRVRYSPSPKRKLSWSWEQIQVINYKNEKIWVGINTLLANNLVRRMIENDLLNKLIGDVDQITAEQRYGFEKKSRIDFLIKPKSSNPDKREIYIEVKNTTWSQQNIALFPDTITKRGQKHLTELTSIIPNSKAILVPCITRNDVEYFRTGDEVDPLYGKLFRESIKAGLLVIPCCLSFYRDHISWHKFIPVLKDEFES